MKNKILELKNIKKSYYTLDGEVNVIDDISFDVYKGEIVAIVGTSGCGKSSLLNIIASLDENYEGKVNLIDNAKTSYMLQTDSLFNWLSIYDNCKLGLKIQNNLNNDTINNIDKMLKLYKLDDFKYKKPSSLSGGMKQRIALIRTLAVNPDILLLDEPFSALDYQTRLAISNDVYKMIKTNNKTAIMVTHDISEAISMADRIIVLSKRPCRIKNIYNIKLSETNNPIDNRKAKEFSKYYETIWKDLDINV